MRSVAWESAAGGSRGRSAVFFVSRFLFSLFRLSFFFFFSRPRLSSPFFFFQLSLRKRTSDVPGLEARERRASVPLRGLEVLAALGELHELAAQVREPPVFEFFFFFLERRKKKVSFFRFVRPRHNTHPK